MRKLIVVFFTLLAVLSTSAQSWNTINSYQRFLKAIGIPVRDTFPGTAADSAQLVIRPQDGYLWYKYKTGWVTPGGGSVYTAGSLINISSNVVNFGGTWTNNVTLNGSGTRNWDMTNAYYLSLGTIGYRIFNFPGAAEFLQVSPVASAVFPNIDTKGLIVYKDNARLDWSTNTGGGTYSTGVVEVDSSGPSIIAAGIGKVKLGGYTTLTQGKPTYSTTLQNIQLVGYRNNVGIDSVLTTDENGNVIFVHKSTLGGGGSQTLASVLNTGRTLTTRDSINNAGQRFVFKGMLSADSALSAWPGAYNYDYSYWEPGIRFKGLDSTGFVMRAGNNLTYVSHGELVSSFYKEGDATYLQFYGTNRGMISSVSALVFNSNTSHYEFEGLGDWRLSVVGYGTGSSQGKTIIYETDPTLAVTPLGAMPRQGKSAFNIYDSTYKTNTLFDYNGNLRIGDTTAHGGTGLVVASNLTANGNYQILLKDKYAPTNTWGIGKENAYTEDLVFSYNAAEKAGITNAGRMFVGLHNPDSYTLSALGTARIRNTAAADNDAAILDLEATNLSNQAIRMRYNPAGTASTIWETYGNFNTGEISTNFANSYFARWKMNGTAAMGIETDRTVFVNNRLFVGGTSGAGLGEKLYVNGTIGILDGSQMVNASGLSGVVISDAAGTSLFYGSGASRGKVEMSPHFSYVVGTTERLRVYSNGNFRIGSIADNGKLMQVDGTTWLNGAVQIIDGTQGAGKVLTSDASGNASWQTAAAADGNNYPAGITYTQATRALAIQRTGLADISTNLPLATSALPGLMAAADKARLDSNAYFNNATGTGDSLLVYVNDSTTKVKRIEVTGSGAITVTPTVTGDKVSYAVSSTGGGMADPGSNGILARTALNTTVARTLTGTTNRIGITNADGTAGAPTFDIGSEVVTTNTAQTISAVKTFTTVNPVFNGVYPTISGGSAGIRVLDQADGREFKWEVNNRKFLVTMQQTDFSYRSAFYFDMAAPADALNLHSTGTLRINSTGTGTDIASRKLYIGGSVGVILDSLPTDASISGSEWVAIWNATTGRAEKTLASNLTGASGVASFSAGATGFTPNTATTGAVTLAGTLDVDNGGTGIATTTPYAILAGGTTSTATLQQVSGLGTSGQVLTSTGAGALPTWQAVPAELSGGSNTALVVWTGTNTVGVSSFSDNGSISSVNTPFTANADFKASATVAYPSTQSITAGSSGTASGGIYRVRFNPASVLTSYTLTMPASPVDGQLLEISTGKLIAAGSPTVTTLTVSPNSGQTIFGAITLTALNSGDNAQYVYEGSTSTWIRIK